VIEVHALQCHYADLADEHLCIDQRDWGLMADKTQGRNPIWTRDELILTLDLFMENREAIPGKNSQEINDLVSDLARLGGKIGLAGDDTLRNANGVHMKLMNFRRLDPDYTRSGKVGLARGGRGDKEVWDIFTGDRQRLRRAAENIRAWLAADGGAAEPSLAAKTDDDTDAEEGAVLTRVHRSRERNRKLVTQKKSAFTAQHGRLFCEACGFDFVRRYGDRGDGFIECHHTRPVSSMRPGEKTKLNDLRLLCANCHRMVHAKSPWLSFDELAALLKEPGPVSNF
jgi:5-methylcytosine-specific restriction enzyme A